jgi:peptidyl-prolyl cis-trans isomerase SurA
MGNTLLKYLVISICLSGVITSYAELIPLDGTVAIVNDDIILGSEVAEQVQFMLSQLDPETVEKEGGVGALTNSVLSEMINDRLLLQQAEELDIAVSKDDVDALADENLAAFRDNFPSEEEFVSYLDGYGITEKSLIKYYRKSIRERLTIRQLIDREIYPKIEIEEEDARDFYKAHKSEFDVPTVVDISEIVVAKRSTAESYKALKQRVLEIKRQAEAGADFGELARKYSTAGNAASGGEFSFKSGEVFPELENAVNSLSPGGISEPIELGDGFWLVEFLGKEGETYKTRTIFLPITVTDADISAARSKIERAYGELERGVPFEKVAGEYSEEEGTAAAGGRVGELDMEVFEKEFPVIAAEVTKIEEGGYTPVVERDEGFYIVRLNSREDGYARGYEDAREDVINVMRSDRVEEELDKYIQGIKDKSYIKVFE